MTLSETDDPPPKRLTTADRTSSTTSVGKASPTGKPRKPRAHVVGAHSRNRSYGKNLNELSKITRTHGEETSGKGKERRDGSRSPPVAPRGHMKRNSSGVNLPRTGSKVSIKRNSSNVSLKRNGSSTQVNKSSRPTTPTTKAKSQSEDLDQNTGGKVTFQMDDDNNDDEWTEESASQSPSVTRHSSASRGGGRSGLSTPGERHLEGRGSALHSRPETPGLDGTQEALYESSQAVLSQQHYSTSSRHKSRLPDADAITSRLLKRGTSSQNGPTLTSISATGTPGTITPPAPNSQETGNIIPDGQSMPENGISRFLNANSSSRDSTYQIGNALQHLQTPPTNSDNQGITRSVSASPSRDEIVRRAKSAHDLTSMASASKHGKHSKRSIPVVTRDSDSTRGKAPESYTFEPPNRRPEGGNTQAKLDLWRTQSHVEPSHNPPAPLIRGAAGAGLLSSEERRVRSYEEAEARLGFLRRFRNPVVDGARRAVKIQKRKEKDLRDTGEGEGRLSVESRRTVGGGKAVNGTVNGDSGGSQHGNVAERGRQDESRPVSRAGPRNVRFEVGLDPGDDLAESPDVDGVEALLRSLWQGGEMENVGD